MGTRNLEPLSDAPAGSKWRCMLCGAEGPSAITLEHAEGCHNAPPKPTPLHAVAVDWEQKLEELRESYRALLKHHNVVETAHERLRLGAVALVERWRTRIQDLDQQKLTGRASEVHACRAEVTALLEWKR